MSDIYKNIDELLTEKGISGAKMCTDLGMSRSFMTELRKGRIKSVRTETAQKIAGFFGVSVGHLLGQNGDVLDQVDIAFYGEYKELNEEEKETVRDMVRLMRERRAAKQRN